MWFVVIYGNLPLGGKDLETYVRDIVYGAPQVTAVEIEDKFVALATFENETNARYTFERMGSFSFGARYTVSAAEAFDQVADLVRHYTRRAATA